MNATTIKLDAALHARIRRLRAREQSLTGYVRELVEREERVRRMEKTAAEYEALLAAHPDEGVWLAEWERAPLEAPLKASRRP